MSEHTPTPWKVESFDPDCTPPRGSVYMYGRTAEVAACHYNRERGAIDLEQAAINAAFIVRAVNSYTDLLVALQTIATLAVRDVHSGFLSQVLQAIESKARAAIAKAETKP